LKAAARAAVAAGLTAYILWRSHPREVLAALAAADWRLIAIAVVLVLADRALMAYRWVALLYALRPDSRQQFTAVMRIFFVSTFVGTFLPASVGGDAVRSYQITKLNVSGGDAVASVFMDRMLGVASILIMAVAGLLIVRDLATSRIVDPVEAGEMIGRGDADAVGMTRALITDPDMPRKARGGQTRSIMRCIGCNACIAHYHAGTPIRCAQNPRTGRERTLPPPTPAGQRLRLVVAGAGPAGLAAAAEAAQAGHEVIIFERAAHIGGQVQLASGTPAHREQATALCANYQALLDRGNVELRLGAPADTDAIAAVQPDLVIIATGARPAPPQQELAGVEVLQVWDVLAGARPRGRVLIADWGGDAAALDCAELLAGEGHEVTLAAGSVVPGETLHQYARNQYLARLARAGVRIEHHLGLRARSISVSPGQSQNKPLGERAASSARKSASNVCSRSPNRCGAAKDMDR